MGILQNMLKGSGKKKEFKEKLRQAQEDLKIEKTLEERSKSSNKRELERYIREKEEEEIKETLNKIRKKQNKDNWKSPKLILKEKTTMLNNDRPILKEKNIFNNNENIFSKKHSIKNKTNMGFWK